jgi:hypothetical protein
MQSFKFLVEIKTSPLATSEEELQQQIKESVEKLELCHPKEVTVTPQT